MASGISRGLIGIGVLLMMACAAFGQNSGTLLPGMNQRFFSTLAAGAPPADQPVKTPTVGTPGGAPFTETAPGGGLLVGFDVWTGFWGLKRWFVIAGVRPIYLTANGVVRGEGHGLTKGDPAATLLARAGYAVAGLESRHGGRFDGLRLVYWGIMPAQMRLDENDTYQSEWIGVPAENHPMEQLSPPNHGQIVIGLTGECQGQVSSLGFIYLQQK